MGRSWLVTSLQAHPEVALFLTLALGYGAARIKIASFQLNLIICVLLAGVVVGQAGIETSAAMQWTFFNFFLFSVGYKIGPQFLRGLGRSALPQIALAVILCVAVLGCAWLEAVALGFGGGAAAGLVAGGLNASAAIGTAGDAIARLAISPEARAVQSTELAVAFAVTYLVGLLTEIITLAKLGPWLMGVDLAAECKTLEAELGVVETDFGVVSAYRPHVARAFALPSAMAGRTALQLEQMFAPSRVFVERLRRAGAIIEAGPDTVLAADDVLVLSGPRAALVGPSNALGAHEIDDRELLDIRAAIVDVVVTRREVGGRALGRLAETVGHAFTRGVFVRSISRGGTLLPLGPGLVLERGDVITLVGDKARVARVATMIGSAQWPTPATDLLIVAGAIVIGALIGLPALKIAGIELGLSLPVGVLAGGMAAGYLHSVRPIIGYVPEAALWVFESLGLSGFIALVGIGAGPGFVSGLEQSGVVLIGAAVVVCLVPNVIAILVGRYVFKMHPGILLGVCAGAGTSPAGLAAVQETAGSRVPTLGYGVSYAVGNVLLALWGTLLVVLMSR